MVLLLELLFLAFLAVFICFFLLLATVHEE